MIIRETDTDGAESVISSVEGSDYNRQGDLVPSFAEDPQARAMSLEFGISTILVLSKWNL
jgi:hypothetical protein